MKNKAEIAFINTCESDIPLVSFSLEEGGERYLAIIDTGSELTLFDYSFVKKNQDYFVDVQNDGEYNVVGVSDNKSIHVSEKSTNFIFKDVNDEDKEIPLLGLSTDLSDLSNRFMNTYGDEFNIVALIGSNEMRKLGCVIDFVKENISLNINNQ